jgi:hypothetical protein
MEFMSAVSSPQTNAPAPMRMIDIEIEIAAEDVFAEHAVLTRLVDGLRLQALDSQRVLRADVYVALLRAYGVRRLSSCPR